MVRFFGKIGQILGQIFESFSQILIISTLPMADFDRHKESVLADPMKSTLLEPLEGLPDPSHIKHKCSFTFVSFDKFRDYLLRC